MEDQKKSNHISIIVRTRNQILWVKKLDDVVNKFSLYLKCNHIQEVFKIIGPK